MAAPELTNSGPGAFSEDDNEDFGALLEAHLPQKMPKSNGELVDATVVRALDDVVLLNYGSKEEAAVPVAEFTDSRGLIIVKPGDMVRVQMVGRDEDGNVIFSYKRARQAEALQMLGQAHESKVPVRGTVSRSVNGGLIVDVAGVPAFMPGSQADIRRIADLETLVGQEIEAYVIDFNEHQGRAVLSRRKLLAERQDSERQQFLSTISPGSMVTGRVRELLDFGAFIDVGSVQGLLPRTEISYDRSVKPADYLKVGQEISLKVLDVSQDTGRLTLSRKRIGEDPWTSVQNSYPIASTVSGKVVAIQSFGAFVQLEEGVTGLIHARDISWESDRKSPDEIFKIGDQVTCQVIEIDSEHRRLGLSLRHLARDPWLDVTDKYPVGSRHTGKITRLKEYGAFVRLDENVEGLLHIGDISWEKRLKHPNEMVAEDQDIDVTVLNHDMARRRISLGHKQLTGSPFEEFIAAHPVGTVVQGTVSRIVPFGAFLQLAPGLEGLIHISELDDNRVDSPERVVRQNEPVTVKILSADPAKQKISLSRKGAIHDQEQENISQYSASEKSKKVGLSFGDALKAAMEKQK